MYIKCYIFFILYVMNFFSLCIKTQCHWPDYLSFLHIDIILYIFNLESKQLIIPECTSFHNQKHQGKTKKRKKSTLTFTRSHDSTAIHLKFKCCWIIDRDIPEFPTNYLLLFPIGRTWGRTDSEGTVLISAPFKFIMRLLWHLSCIK